MQNSHQILKNIRAIREIKGISQDQLSRILGITQSKYARFEKEGKKIDYKLIERSAKALHVNIEFIINFHINPVYIINNLNDTPDSSSQKTHVADPIALQAELNYVKKLNEQLMTQLEDKEQIINLFRKMNQDQKTKK
jgi:transcriptional regulator with XRE-family HTH domain